jgi:hypothetical protein
VTALHLPGGAQSGVQGTDFQGTGARVDFDMPLETWNCLMVVQSAAPSLFLAFSSYLESLIEIMIVTAESVVPAICGLTISCV